VSQAITRKDLSGPMTNPLAGRILFATDFSGCAARTWEYVLFLGKTCGAKLDILHVLEFQPGMDPDYDVNRMYLEQLRKQAVQQLDELVNLAALTGISAQGRITQGIPSQQIKEVAKECGAVLAVLGTHGWTGLEHILLGSTAERVVRGAPCPVLTVRMARAGAPPPESAVSGPIRIQQILVPIDFSDCSLDALEFAAQVAEQFKAKVTVLHVMEPVTYGLDFTIGHAAERDKKRELIKARLAELTRALTSCGVTADRVLCGGLPVDSILDRARVQASDLIVMGTHGRRGLAHLLTGSVAEAVLRQARCPVLTVRSPKFTPEHRRVVSAEARQPSNIDGSMGLR